MQHKRQKAGKGGHNQARESEGTGANADQGLKL
jgi:hypothetical protein